MSILSKNLKIILPKEEHIYALAESINMSKERIKEIYDGESEAYYSEIVNISFALGIPAEQLIHKAQVMEINYG